MSFLLIDQVLEKNSNLKIETYKHSMKGLQFVYVEDKNCQHHTTINITVKTPVVNNSGVSHVVEHCIASELDSSKLTKYLAYTSLGRTSFELVMESSKCNEFDTIFKEIFFPEFRKDIQIFLREGWRIKGNKVEGIVFDEIKESYTNPLYRMMNEIPASLYKNIQQRCFAGGILEDILGLTYEDVLQYHERNYTFENCCVYAYGSGSKEIFMKALLRVVEGSSSVEKKQFDPQVLKYEEVNERNIKTITYEGNSVDHYISHNFKVENPRNRLEYNLYMALSDFLTNDHYGILNQTYADDNKTNYLIKSGFKNLPTPYFTTILGLCPKNEMQEFQAILNKSIKCCIDKISDLKEIPDYIGSHFYNKNVDPRIVGRYIMEAFVLDIPILSYIKTVTTTDEVLKKSIQTLKDTFFNNNSTSTLMLEPKNGTTNIKNTVIEAATKISLKYPTYSIKEKKQPLGTISFDNKNNPTINTTGELVPEVLSLDAFKFYVYEGDFPLNKVTLYFQLAELRKANIISLNIATKYISQYFYTKYQDQSAKCYLKTFSGNLYLVFSVTYSDQGCISKIKEFYDEFLNFTNEKSQKLQEQLKVAYKVDIKNSPLNYLILRQGAYFSKSGFYEDQLRGIGNYLGLNYIEISEMKLCPPIVSLYSQKPKEDLSQVVLHIKGKPYSKKNSFEPYEVIDGNEAFIISSQLNYLSMGFDLGKLDKNQQLKLNLISNIIMKMHLSKELREGNNVYSSSANLKDNTLIYSTIKDPNIVKSIEMFNQTTKFLKDNKNQLLSILNKIEIENSQNQKIGTWENDFSTLKLLFPTEFGSSLLNPQEGISTVELDNLIVLWEQLINNKKICMIGNQQEIQKNEGLFQSIKYI